MKRSCAICTFPTDAHYFYEKCIPQVFNISDPSFRILLPALTEKQILCTRRLKLAQTDSLWRFRRGRGGQRAENEGERFSGIHFALTRTATQNEREEGRKKARKHIGILKSFIVLQKSSYYLTRNKDKWQIFYITNARAAHIMALFLHGVEQQTTFTFGLLAQAFLRKSKVLVFKSTVIQG